MPHPRCRHRLSIAPSSGRWCISQGAARLLQRVCADAMARCRPRAREFQCPLQPHPPACAEAAKESELLCSTGPRVPTIDEPQLLGRIDAQRWCRRDDRLELHEPRREPVQRFADLCLAAASQKQSGRRAAAARCSQLPRADALRVWVLDVVGSKRERKDVTSAQPQAAERATMRTDPHAWSLSFT